jgi:two-component system OmpR family response regulator
MNATDKIKIFLVDDDKMFTETLRHALDEEKREIRTFPTGEECLESVKKEDPKIVVVDYYLNSISSSAMNGIQVLNRIKQANPDTEVIMLSSQDSVNVARDTLKYGAYDYIAKGQSAFVKVKNTVEHICDTLEQTDDFDKETKRLKRINVVIVAVVILIYILNRII